MSSDISDADAAEYNQKVVGDVNGDNESYYSADRPLDSNLNLETLKFDSDSLPLEDSSTHCVGI